MRHKKIDKHKFLYLFVTDAVQEENTHSLESVEDNEEVVEYHTKWY